MITILEIKNLHTIRFAAKQFINFMEACENKVFCFNGEMGAGKTTFIKAISEELGVKETINSPTFAIVNEYQTARNKIIYHMDCYRVNSLQEAMDIGIAEYLDSGNYCFIEWAENINEMMPGDEINVDIEEINDGIRMITLYEKNKNDEK